jgi:hypothetical protein
MLFLGEATEGKSGACKDIGFSVNCESKALTCLNTGRGHSMNDDDDDDDDDDAWAAGSRTVATEPRTSVGATRT